MRGHDPCRPARRRCCGIWSITTTAWDRPVSGCTPRRTPTSSQRSSRSFTRSTCSRPAPALFRAPALIPGVTVVRSATDAAGGHGIAVATTGTLGHAGPFRFELIFDPRTYRFIGLQYIALTSAPGQIPGHVVHAETVISSRVVNTAPADYAKIGSTPITEGGVPTCIAHA